MVRHTSKILQQMLEDFKSVSDHFGTLCIKGLKQEALLLFTALLQSTFACSRATTTTSEKYVKSLQNQQQRHQVHFSNFEQIAHIVLVFSLLTLNK